MIGNKANILDYTFPTWIAEETYNINDIVFVESDNSYYISSTNSNMGNNPPDSPDFWVLYSSGAETSSKNWYTYFIAGYEDPNVYTISQTLETIFLGTDFNMNIYTNPATAQLYSIPAQPTVKYQTLNLRLGFTFNGIYNWSDQTTITFTTPSQLNQNFQILTFNRLRPVPQYDVLSVGDVYAPQALPAIPANNPYTSTTYTAENFANLVYSSVVSIYTSIIGPSTTDTQRNTNLLSIVPMDCNNLGITFYEPRISNKLTKIIRDIYSIYFEFRREDGSPYYFSNNAIITLQLGLTY